MQEGDSSSGEPEGGGSFRAIDWGSPILQAEFRHLNDEFTDWSSHSSSEEEWEWRYSQEKVEVLSEVMDAPESSEGTEGSVQAPVCVRWKFPNRLSTTQTRAAKYRQWVVRSPKACILPGKRQASGTAKVFKVPAGDGEQLWCGVWNTPMPP